MPAKYLVLVNHLYPVNFVLYYLGVDMTVPTNSNEDNINYIQSDCLNFIKRDISNFNTFMIIDLLHHLPKKNLKHAPKHFQH